MRNEFKELRELQNKFNMRKIKQLEYMEGIPVPNIGWLVNEKDIRRRRQEIKLEKLYRDAYLAWDQYYDNCCAQFGSSPVKDAYWSIYALGPYVWKPPIRRKLITHPLPKIGWTITQGDLIRKRQEKEYVWNSHIRKKNKCNIFTYPIHKYVRDMFGKRSLPQKSPTTMEFRRFPALLIPEYELDILVQALLGFPQPMGYREGRSSIILNDDWTINLTKSTHESENIMMDSFLRGFNGKSEQLKKAYEDKQMISVNVDDELEDLLKVYTDAEEHLSQKEKQALETMTSCMKRYLDAQEERRKVTLKLNTLKHKLEVGQREEEVEDEEQDDE